jgi:DNA-binding NarL/FixJ family response regulator
MSLTQRQRNDLDSYITGHYDQFRRRWTGRHPQAVLGMPLTPAQQAVYNLLVTTDLGVKQIAAELEISYDTAETHVENLSCRLGVHGRAGIMLRRINELERRLRELGQ